MSRRRGSIRAGIVTGPCGILVAVEENVRGWVVAAWLFVVVLFVTIFEFVALALGLTAVTDKARLVAKVFAILFAVFGAGLVFAATRPARSRLAKGAIATTGTAFLGGMAALVCWTITTTPMPN